MKVLHRNQKNISLDCDGSQPNGKSLDTERSQSNGDQFKKGGNDNDC